MPMVVPDLREANLTEPELSLVQVILRRLRNCWFRQPLPHAYMGYRKSLNSTKTKEGVYNA